MTKLKAVQESCFKHPPLARFHCYLLLLLPCTDMNHNFSVLLIVALKRGRSSIPFLLVFLFFSILVHALPRSPRRRRMRLAKGKRCRYNSYTCVVYTLAIYAINGRLQVQFSIILEKEEALKASLDLP